jgi:hypothetical protein
MPNVVRAFPLIRPVSELQTFLSELTDTRKADTDKFYRQYGVSHESVHMQETPHGTLLIVVTTIKDQHQSAPLFKEASEEFHTWFKARLLHLTGVDANVTPLGPPTTEVFSWPATAA